MGTYLSTPNTEKSGEDGVGEGIRWGVSSMQGWRIGMEDAHITLPLVGDGIKLFAVFDGHGGKEVAQFCAKYMAGELQFLCQKASDLNEKTLKDAFHRMDHMLRQDQYAEELAVLSGRYNQTDGSSPTASPKPRAPTSRERAAQMVRTSLNASLDEAKKKGKLSKKEATELLVKMMALNRMENQPTSSGSASGGAASGSASSGSAPEDDEPSSTSAGCTANVMVVVDRELWIANAGDSRAVLCHAGKAIEMSFDHKPNQPREMDRISSAGGWVTDGSTGHYRVNGNLNLSRSIGDLKYKSNTQLGPEQQIITAEPDVQRRTLIPGDEFIVLACDGVFDVLSSQVR